MDYVKRTPASKGQFKCFHCRVVTRSKDGAWHETAEQQVFLCKLCEKTPAAKLAPMAAKQN